LSILKALQAVVLLSSQSLIASRRLKQKIKYTNPDINSPLTVNLNESDATKICKLIWGNKASELVQQSLSNEHFGCVLNIEPEAMLIQAYMV
jgi:hypothetical protein